MTQPQDSTRETDGQTNSMEEGLIPTDDNSDVPTIPPSSVPISLTKSELELAAEEIGMSRVRVRKWRAYSVIGEELEKIGAVRVCAGELLFSNQVRLEAIQKCRRMLSKENNVMNVLAIGEMLNQLLDSKDASTGQLLKAIQSGSIDKKPEASDGPRTPPRGFQIIAQNVQVRAAEEKPAG